MGDGGSGVLYSNGLIIAHFVVPFPTFGSELLVAFQIEQC